MITIVDYNMGNLRSVSKAIEHLGGSARITSNPSEIQNAEKLILPGVGAFGDAMSELAATKLIAPIREFAKSGKPFLGICLGLQLLFESSEESKGAEGLGIFKGTVRAFRSKTVKVPHMGWNNSKIMRPHPVLKGLPDNSFFYFVHSFYAVPEDKELTLAQTEYGGETFPAILGKGNVTATQFHPEKSQEAGLLILKNFIEL